jgi:hypothetical protein
MARGRLRRQGTPDELRRPRDGVERFALTIAGPVDGHVAALQSLEGMQEVEVVAAGADEHTIAYRTATPRRTNAGVVAALVGRGTEVVSLAPRPRLLSEVYLETMEEAERCP